VGSWHASSPLAGEVPGEAGGLGAPELARILPPRRGGTRRSRGVGAPELAYILPARRGGTRRSRGVGAPELAAAYTLDRMSLVQRDYIERMIEQAVQAIAQIIQLIRAGDLDPAIILVHKTRDLVLGPMRPVLERVDAASAVDLVGKYELDRLRMFAALLGEEGAIHELRGNSAKSEHCYRHALELYAAASLAGARLKAADSERIAILQPKVEPGSIDSRYREELRRLAAQAAPSQHEGRSEVRSSGGA
jgi:hypothetical protein